MNGRESQIASPFHIGDVVLTDDARIGVYYGDGAGTYGTVVYLDEQAGPTHMGVPWSALSAPSGLWRCWCPRFWNVATAPAIRCDGCGATRV